MSTTPERLKNPSIPKPPHRFTDLLIKIDQQPRDPRMVHLLLIEAVFHGEQHRLARIYNEYEPSTEHAELESLTGQRHAESLGKLSAERANKRPMLIFFNRFSVPIPYR